MKEKQMVLTRFMDSLDCYKLPTWEELPKLDLYMDQVVTLMEEYLRIYHAEKEKLISLMNRTDQLATDIGSIVEGQEAVDLGIIDAVGGLSDAINEIKKHIEK